MLTALLAILIVVVFLLSNNVAALVKEVRVLTKPDGLTPSLDTLPNLDTLLSVAQSIEEGVRRIGLDCEQIRDDVNLIAAYHEPLGKEDEE